MLAMRRSTRNLIVLFIIVLSVFLGVKISGFQLARPKVETIDTREADRVYSNAQNIRKTRINYTVPNFQEAADEFHGIIANDEITQYYYDRKPNNLVAIVEIPADIRDQSLLQLRNIDGLENEKTESTPDLTAGMIDTESHIEQNQLILNRFRERLTSPHLTTREIDELHNSIRQTQTKIDSLRSLHSVEQARNKHLVMAVMRTHTPLQTSSHIKGYVRLATWSGISFVILTIAAILIYIAFELLSKLMGVLGIRSAKGSSRDGYNYQYGYGYGSRRKKKKKYVKKDKDDDSDEGK